ncbi:MAG: hypothetical protein GY780_13565 [bacterium]|nr:hypothetical protein [bacterium]
MSVLWTSPAWIWPLLLVTAAGAVFLTVRFYGQSKPDPSKGLRQILVVFRSIALLLLVLAVGAPLLSRVFSTEIAPELVFVVEDSASMDLPSDGDGSFSRWEVALDVMSKVEASLTELDVNFSSRMFRGNGLEELNEFDMADPVIGRPVNHGTFLESLLRGVNLRLAADPVQAVVLLSDGNETISAGEQNGLQPDRRLHSSAQFFIGGVGDAQGTPDRIISDLRYPQTAFQGDRVTFEATVVQNQFAVRPNETATVWLMQGEKILAEKDIKLESEVTNFEISVVPDKLGLQVFELKVSPLVLGAAGGNQADSFDNERFLSNNQVSFGVDIHKARSRLLLLADRPGWNVRFLAQAAQRETRLALDVVYSTEQGLVFADSMIRFVEPNDLEKWQSYDGVILLGWGGGQNHLDYKLLSEAVRAGLGLWVLPPTGEDSASLVKNLPNGLRELLPVSLSSSRRVKGPWFASAPDAATDHPVFSGFGQGSGMEFLKQAPPVLSILENTAKPGVQTLLTVSSSAQGADKQKPLLVTGENGKGRTVFWSGSRLWEMAFWARVETESREIENSGVRLLLRNLLVWLADGTEESGLSFVGRQPFFQEGEPVLLAGQWLDMRGQNIADGRVSLMVHSLNENSKDFSEQTYPSTGFDPESQQYGFDLHAIPPGRYGIKLVGHGDQEVESTEAQLVVTSHSVEETQNRQDARRLKLLANRLSGGRYIDLTTQDSITELVNQLAQLSWESKRVSNRKQWDPVAGWPFLVLVVLLLVCEWFLRRRHGLL